MILPHRSFYYVRHGFTDANRQGLWCGGDWDIEINEIGEEQARKAAHKIREVQSEIDAIFCSPMKRALQTAQLINSHAGKPMTIIDGLREWRVGEIEQTPWQNFPLEDPIPRWKDPPGGETVTQFRDRIQNAIRHGLENCDRPLFVSHGAAGRMLIHILGLEDRHIDNCVVHRFYPVQTSSGVLWKVE